MSLTETQSNYATALLEEGGRPTEPTDERKFFISDEEETTPFSNIDAVAAGVAGRTSVGPAIILIVTRPITKQEAGLMQQTLDDFNEALEEDKEVDDDEYTLAEYQVELADAGIKLSLHSGWDAPENYTVIGAFYWPPEYEGAELSSDEELIESKEEVDELRKAWFVL